ncbi:MAG TPA: hypothetical protein PLI09_20825 [Candidatus Hydrogenedentes bacterium]|nr:hypothetical protein [Candidatus Hydrogenedentota bacterium]
MKSFYNIIENPLLRATHARRRAILLTCFPDLSNCNGDHFLSLWKYINHVPERFYSTTVYEIFSSWLREKDKTNKTALRQYFLDHDAEMNRAFLHLQEINTLDWHDSFEKLDDYEIIRFIEREIHPTYLRLAEGVLMPLLLVVAIFSRVEQGKGTNGLDLWNVIQEILNTTLSEAVASYRHIVRNGIAHGGINYLQKEVKYRDKKGNEEKYADGAIVKLCDDLLDSCNGLALAISLFLLTHQTEDYRLPRELLLEELKAETRTPWWEITGCTPCEFTNQKQLIIYARPRTSDYRKVQISTFQSGLLAERFAPGFDRYFFSLKSTTSWPGWAAFNGTRLNELRMKENLCLEDYRGVIENDLVFYVPRFKLPKVVSWFQNITISAALQWPLTISDIRRNLGWPEIRVRNAIIHRNSWGCVLNGAVVVNIADVDHVQDLIRKSRHKIIKTLLSKARRNTSVLSIARYLPLGFAHVAVFSKDYRCRRLASFGLGKELICTIQFQRIQRIKRVDILHSTVEQIGLYRIAWNKAWLDWDKSGQQILRSDSC